MSNNPQSIIVVSPRMAPTAAPHFPTVSAPIHMMHHGVINYPGQQNPIMSGYQQTPYRPAGGFTPAVLLGPQQLAQQLRLQSLIRDQQTLAGMQGSAQQPLSQSQLAALYQQQQLRKQQTVGNAPLAPVVSAPVISSRPVSAGLETLREQQVRLERALADATEQLAQSRSREQSLKDDLIKLGGEVKKVSQVRLPALSLISSLNFQVDLQTQESPASPSRRSSLSLDEAYALLKQKFDALGRINNTLRTENKALASASARDNEQQIQSMRIKHQSAIDERDEEIRELKEELKRRSRINNEAARVEECGNKVNRETAECEGSQIEQETLIKQPSDRIPSTDENLETRNQVFSPLVASKSSKRKNRRNSNQPDMEIVNAAFGESDVLGREEAASLAHKIAGHTLPKVILTKVFSAFAGEEGQLTRSQGGDFARQVMHFASK